MSRSLPLLLLAPKTLLVVASPHHPKRAASPSLFNLTGQPSLVTVDPNKKEDLFFLPLPFAAALPLSPSLRRSRSIWITGLGTRQQDESFFFSLSTFGSISFDWRRRRVFIPLTLWLPLRPPLPPSLLSFFVSPPSPFYAFGSASPFGSSSRYRREECCFFF